MAEQAQKMEFKSELKQILNLITHSLYSHKEVFLREMISNASDAIDKMRFDSLNNEAVLENNKEWKIKISHDAGQGTLTISDNGVGMTRETVIENLGTIAKSGTKEFLDQLKAADAASRPELIGQFGVGFYSAFMVADTVTVITRAAGNAEGVKWVSDGQGEYTIEPCEKPSRGTDVTLHLKADEKEFIDEWKIRSLVKEFSDFIEHPIVMDVESEDENKNKTVTEETLNSRKALWLRPKSEVTKEEYEHFYKQISNDFNQPARTIHYTGEGTVEFKVLLFLPSKKPFDMMFGDVKVGPKLYIRRVLVMDHCEQLLPQYMRFVKGVVDCSDLPLNVSREMLQQNPMLERIKNNLVKSVLKNLEDMKAASYDEYVSFFTEFGMFLKEGLSHDYANREQLSKLMLFESMKTEEKKYITLTQYVEAMPEDQKEIYYLTGESRDLVAHTPYLEVFKSKGWDVLFMTDPIDEFILPSLTEFDGKKLTAADKSDASLPSESEKKEEAQKEYAVLFGAVKSSLDQVKDVRVSTRLKESASCLVSDKDAMSANMERIMQKLKQGGDMKKTDRILELNIEHPVVIALKKIYDANASDARIATYAELLYEQAVIAEGSKVKDPVAFANMINQLLVQSAGV